MREAEELSRGIKQRVASLNKEAHAPYELSVCIGIAKADKPKELKEIIAEADEKLYEEKKR